MNRITRNLAILIIAETIMAFSSLSIIVSSGFVQPVSAQGGIATTGAATDFGSSSSASDSDFFKGTSNSVSSSGNDSGSASGSIAICGSTVAIHGVCTKATR